MEQYKIKKAAERRWYIYNNSTGEYFCTNLTGVVRITTECPPEYSCFWLSREEADKFLQEYLKKMNTNLTFDVMNTQPMYAVNEDGFHYGILELHEEEYIFTPYEAEGEGWGLTSQELLCIVDKLNELNKDL